MESTGVKADSILVEGTVGYLVTTRIPYGVLVQFHRPCVREDFPLTSIRVAAQK